MELDSGELKSKFNGFDRTNIKIPEWHKDIVRQRLADDKKAPEQALDFDAAMDDIEKVL